VGRDKGNAMLTVHHLNESRSQRILWLLEELGVSYELKAYQRDAQTRLAPPELKAVNALGKSPMITDGPRTIIETGAIIDYIIRHNGEGSAMLPLMLHMYVGRLKEAGAPLHPRIQSEVANHLGFIEGHLRNRTYFVGDSLTGADVQMSFVAEVARAQQSLPSYPAFNAWLDRMHERPAWKRAIDKGGPYALGR
jgi:glutathione S-transferase